MDSHTHEPGRLRAATKTFGPIAAAVLLLTAVAAHDHSLPGPEDAAPYHRRVKEAVAAMPDDVGPWQGEDAELPRSAVELLKPNALRMRRYTHASEDTQFSLLVVHCKDARDLLGHYPPNCYPATGWRPRGAQPTTWTVGDHTIPGMTYRFDRPEKGPGHRTVVMNFMISPRGRFVPRIEALWDPAADPRRRFFGAGQVQCLISADVPEQQRRAIFTRMLKAHDELLSALQSSAPAK
jgi:hypothetical protein